MGDNQSVGKSLSAARSRQVRLREFQANLAERLRVASTTSQGNSRLGILIGAQRFLLSLDEAGEIAPVPDAAAVPLTQPWFKGLFTLRGNLRTMIDLAHFIGVDPTPLDKNSRVMAFNDRLQFNASILVTRMLGLRNLDNLKLVSAAPATQPWIGQTYEDGDGNQWTELHLHILMRDEHFLSVAQ